MGASRPGKLVAYIIPGFFGHGVAESADDLLTAVSQAARVVPPLAHRVFIPAQNGELFRQVLRLKMRSIKMMSLMALGPYEEPLSHRRREPHGRHRLHIDLVLRRTTAQSGSSRGFSFRVRS